MFGGFEVVFAFRTYCFCDCFFNNFIVCIVGLKVIRHRLITVSDFTPASDKARMGAPFKPSKRDLARMRFQNFAHFFNVRFATFKRDCHKLPI